MINIRFIAYYLDSLIEMKYVDGRYYEFHELIDTDTSIDFVKKMIRSALNDYIKSAKESESEYRDRGMNPVADDLKKIIHFLQKNLDIFNRKVKPEYTPKVNIKYSSASQKK